jgi:hypothetical protein
MSCSITSRTSSLYGFKPANANAVVYYNSAILSEDHSTLKGQTNQAPMDTLPRVTPLVRQHINFYRKYRFDGDLKPIDLAKVAAELAWSDLNRRAVIREGFKLSTLACIPPRPIAKIFLFQ